MTLWPFNSSLCDIMALLLKSCWIGEKYVAVAKWFVPPPEEGGNGPEQGLWQGDQEEGKQGKEVWGLILCKVPSGMVHMREYVHCPRPELFVEFVKKSEKKTTGAFIVPLPGLVDSFGLARWQCQTNKSSGSKRGEGC